MKNNKYTVRSHRGEVKTASSMTSAKKIARRMCGKRLWWQEWVDGTIVGDYQKGYSGVNPAVAIRKN